MAKRGRPRKPGVRFPNGKLKPMPCGPTPQLIAKRVARLVIAGVDAGKPPPKLDNTGLEGPEQHEFFRLAASWLGVLYAANVIDALQFRAGNHYHELYKAMFPQGFPGSVLDADVKCIDGTLVQSCEPDDEADDLGLAWKTTEEKILRPLGRRTHDLVKNICVFGRFERFIDVSSPRPMAAWRADAEDRTRFVEGLDALATAYGYKAAQQDTRRAPFIARAA